MGMDLFNPPGVNGWNHAGRLARHARATASASASPSGSRRDAASRTAATRSRPRSCSTPRSRTPPQIVDGLLARFGVRNVPAASRQSLIDYVDGGLALSDEEWLEIKFRGLLVLIFTLPEFQVH